MSRKSDTGNFVMLLLAAGAAGAFIGDWAFKVVLFIGMGVMVVGAVAYIVQAWGIKLDEPRQVAPTTEALARRTHRNPDKDVEALLQAVAARDGRSIERLVLGHNVSPFQNAPWHGTRTSAHDLALSTSYTEASTFFSEWSAKGSAARFIRQVP